MINLNTYQEAVNKGLATGNFGSTVIISTKNSKEEKETKKVEYVNIVLTKDEAKVIRDVLNVVGNGKYADLVQKLSS